MKVVITGNKGYISKSIFSWFKERNSTIEIELISVRDSLIIPTNTDVLIHTAALVHKKEHNYQESDYFSINCDLTIKLAEKAKGNGVKHFIFFSTMAVYGIEDGEINSCSKLQPITNYGKSKLVAEKKLIAMQDEDFLISIIRPPMVYGPNCPGNYTVLRKVARNIPFFLNIQNFRSMIFINNLTEFVYQIIINCDSGIFHPQDSEYVTTSQMVKEIAQIHRKRLFLVSLSGRCVKSFIERIGIFKKVFGSLHYNKSLSKYRDNSYQIYNLKESLKITEKNM